MDSPTDPSQAAAPGTDATRQVRHITGWRRLLVWPLALLVKLWLRSLRFQESPETAKLLRQSPSPVAFVLWHNRLFAISEISRRYRPTSPVYGLVSASRDGAWLEAFFSMVGIRAVRGSSSRLGREAVTAIIDTLRAGHDVGVTPDGPRGPCYDFKAGALIVARRSHASMVLIGMTYSSAWRLKSWDRLFVPKPFSRVAVHAEHVDPSDMEGDREEVAAKLRARLLASNPDPTP